MKRSITSLREGLLQEHETIAVLLERVIEAVAAGGEVEGPWKAFATALLAHLDAEDGQLISSLPRAHERTSRALAQEHRHLRDRAAELQGRQPLGPSDIENLQGFLDVLQAHARNDERLLYPWAESELDAAKRNAVLETLELRIGSRLEDHD